MYLYSFNEKGTAVGLLCSNDNGIRFNRRDSFLFFFLVLCLPRQVRTCCNPLSSSSSVTSFLVFLFSFSLQYPVASVTVLDSIGVTHGTHLCVCENQIRESEAMTKILLQ